MKPIRHASLLLLTSLLAFSACHKKKAPPGADDVLAEDVQAGAGDDKAGALRCDEKGKSCEPLGANQSIPAGSVVRAARGGHATVALDAATKLELDDDAAVLVNAHNDLELQQGAIALRRAAGPHAASDVMRLKLGGRTAELDAKLATDVRARARDEKHAMITVEKGKATLRGSGGESLMLLSGETVDLAPGRPPLRSASFLTMEPSSRLLPPKDTSRPPVQIASSRGLGRMSARVPGQNAVVSGVRLVSHHVDIAVRDGIARTEVEEVFQNDTSQVLEGRYVFPLPTDASISRLALWIGDKPVEGEIVEKKRAASIFRNIVDDTVRPRDPALLEWVAGGDFSLKIFPLPAKGTRKVKLAYDQALTAYGDRMRYVYPLNAGSERSNSIDDFSIRVRTTDTRAKVGDFATPGYATRIRDDDRSSEITFAAKTFLPDSDFIVSYAREADGAAEFSQYVPSWGAAKGTGFDDAAHGADGSGYVALRMRADLAENMSPPAHVRRDRIMVVDASHGQSPEALTASLRLAVGLADRLDEGEHFAVLLCDSACEAFPESGLADAGTEATDKLERWTKDRSAHGSTDIAGALIDAAHRLEPGGSGQIVYIGDGSASSGELSVARIAERVRPLLAEAGADLRILGAGRALDPASLEGLASELGGTYEPLATGESLAKRIAEVALELRSPVITHPRVELPGAFSDVYPRRLPNIRLGQEIVLVGRLGSWDSQSVALTGELGGKPYRLAKTAKWTQGGAMQNPLVPRLWALARIDDLQQTNDAPTTAQVIDMSKKYHVMSRYTSLLVLENDAMYAEYGIKRTSGGGGFPDKELAVGSPLTDPLQMAAPAPTAGLDRLGDAPAASAASGASDEPQRAREPGSLGAAHGVGNSAVADNKGESREESKEKAGKKAPMAAAEAPRDEAARPMPAPAAPAPRRAAKDDGDFAPAPTTVAQAPAAAAPRPAGAPAAMSPSPAMSPPPPAKPASRPAESEMADKSRRSEAQEGFGSDSLQIATDSSGSGVGIGAGASGHSGQSGLGALGGVSDPLNDLASGAGRLGGPSSVNGMVRFGAVQVSDGLPREVVQRIVRQNFGRFRMCYENGLRANPDLKGSVVITFTINPRGEVESVTPSGGDMPDPGVRSCTTRAFLGLSFPQPEGRFVSVLQTLIFAPGAPVLRQWERAWHPPQPSAVHRPGDEAWTRQGDDALAKLRAAVEGSPESRKRHEDLTRGLLLRGRFEEARREAERFVALDPDLALAEELFSYAAAAANDARAAVTAVDDQTESDPANVARHARAARAFESLGDERRACAHWRSLAELSAKTDEYVFQSLRCRARVLDDRAGALADARAVLKPGKLLDALLPDLENGHPPAFERSSGSAGQFEAQVTCSSSADRCPTVLVVSPTGAVLSPLTPTDARSTTTSVAINALHEGTYRTLLVGGSDDARGQVKLRAFGNTRTFDFSRGGRQTVASTQITIPSSRGWGLGGLNIAR